MGVGATIGERPQLVSEIIISRFILFYIVLTADVVGAVGCSITPPVNDPRDRLRYDVGHVAEQGKQEVGRRLRVRVWGGERG